MKDRILKRRLFRYSGLVGVAALLFGTTGCKDDLLTGQPSWLGQSIYEELEDRGNFKETLKLINAQSDDYASVLRKTGSKTIFVADDAAWKKFYENNPWGVKSIDEMSEAQKSILFKGNMINSAYLVELLGNTPSSSASAEPKVGECMRRASSVGAMDTVPLLTRDKYPLLNPARLDVEGQQIDYWARVREKESVHVLPYNTPNIDAPMVHFVPRFMKNRHITSYDVQKMTNNAIQTNDSAFVNGQKITEENITCQNGYIHVLEGVAIPLDNMATIIANDPELSLYSSLLDRFSYPHYDAEVNREYHRVYGGDLEDSVFVKRYFTSNFNTTDDGTTINNILSFDPGWTHYYVAGGDGSGSFQTNGAVMLVPTNEAMEKYMRNDGADILEKYGNGDVKKALTEAPDEIIIPILNNTMLPSLLGAIPSLFKSVNNTANEAMGLESDHVIRTLWANNGIIYKTNTVFVAPDYLSVFSPCVLRSNEDLRLFYRFIQNDDNLKNSKANPKPIAKGLKAYLTDMSNNYSLIIPTNNALKRYYDPVSYNRTVSGKSTSCAYEFLLNNKGYLTAIAYAVDWSNPATFDEKGRPAISDTKIGNTWQPGDSDQSKGNTFNHMEDIFNTSLAIDEFVPGQKFYTSRIGSPIVVQWDGNVVTGVAGSFQYERNYFIPVTDYVNKKQGNGSSYIIDEEPIMTTTLSPVHALTNNDNFSNFADLVKLANMTAIKYNDHATIDSCITILDNYHYTIYVPTNESIQQLIDAKKLPSVDLLDDAQNALEGMKSAYDDAVNEENEELAKQIAQDTAYIMKQIEHIRTIAQNFVKYHIQDNAVYIDGKDYIGDENSTFESACIDTISKRFLKLNVNYRRGGQLTVTDNAGVKHTVDSRINNILTRQYYFDGSSRTSADNKVKCMDIFTSSFAVLHQIDSPFVFYKDGDTKHPDGGLFDPEDWDKIMTLVQKYVTD